jgi:hypothetical protein
MKRAAPILVLLLLATSCASLPAPAKVVLTPLTVVRDVVDVPLASLANVFEYWAGQNPKTPTPHVGVGIGSGGVKPQFGINLGYYAMKPFSWIFGGVDYLICRSLWPNWPKGISPWKAEGETVGSIYFPNTRALWRDADGG